MHALQDVVQYADTLLNTQAFKDFPGAYNGLQVANTGSITKIAAMVDAGLTPITEAIERGANLIIAHHGLFWNPERRLIDTHYTKI
ncbi:MAG TPA: Nif3-like dinuclear metal center hexameric protein, partial [Opitutales bacterium]|nr:Nif3-like dinuclear metal center hexameric protein [Opitutales bacterium]